MADDKRIAKRKEGEEWVTIPFEDLRKGDLFQLFESDGEPVIDRKTDRTDWTCTSDAFLGPYGPDKTTVWTVECE